MPNKRKRGSNPSSSSIFELDDDVVNSDAQRARGKRTERQKGFFDEDMMKGLGGSESDEGAHADTAISSVQPAFSRAFRYGLFAPKKNC